MLRENSIFQNLKEYDPKLDRFSSVPMSSFIIPLDAPSAVAAAAADHMRDDDYVIGARLGSEARAYPFWIIDYYHVVNDRIQGEPIAVFS